MVFKDSLIETAAYYLVASAAAVVGTVGAVLICGVLYENDTIGKIKQKMSFNKKKESE